MSKKSNSKARKNNLHCRGGGEACKGDEEKEDTGKHGSFIVQDLLDLLRHSVKKEKRKRHKDLGPANFNNGSKVQSPNKQPAARRKQKACAPPLFPVRTYGTRPLRFFVGEN